MTARALPDFDAQAAARAKLLALAHQHLVCAKGLMEQAAALIVADATGRAPVKIVAYREGDGPAA